MNSATVIDVIAPLFVLTGTLLLVISLIQTHRICQQAREATRVWVALFAMVASFIPGYFAYLVLLHGKSLSPADVVVSIILFGGAVFVYAVSRLSLATIGEMKRIAALERHRASHDALTGLPNRCFFTQRIDEHIGDVAQGESNRFAVLFMDIDRFKVVNDTLGHRFGDILLKEVSARLRGVLNDSHTLARIGGDEFAVIVEHGNGARQIAQLSDRIMRVLSQPFLVEGHPADVDISLGIAAYPEHGRTSHQLVRRAEIAMYVAKTLPSHSATFSPRMDNHSIDQLSILGDLRRAIEHDELILHFHPQADVRTRSISGVEALVRWPHPKHGLLFPDKFVPMAEQSGIVHLVDRWVLEQAFTILEDWHRQGIDLSVSVNLSARSLQDAELVQMIVRGIHAERFPPERLRLEITESAVMADPEQALEVISRLNHFGVQFSIDDFGTGYSSLSYLKRLPASEIKIDKSFVLDMTKDENDAVIVRSTIDLAHNLGRCVIAEGVEDQEILDRLITLGCDQVQGYYLSRPLSLEALQSWVQSSSNRLESLLQPI